MSSCICIDFKTDLLGVLRIALIVSTCTASLSSKRASVSTALTFRHLHPLPGTIPNLPHHRPSTSLPFHWTGDVQALQREPTGHGGRRLWSSRRHPRLQFRVEESRHHHGGGGYRDLQEGLWWTWILDGRRTRCSVPGLFAVSLTHLTRARGSKHLADLSRLFFLQRQASMSNACLNVGISSKGKEVDISAVLGHLGRRLVPSDPTVWTIREFRRSLLFFSRRRW